MFPPTESKRECRRKKDAERWPFCSDAFMIGPPSCTLNDLRRPRLRKCPFDIGSTTWIKPLGGGLDGYCWKVMFGNEGPYVIKLFWDREQRSRASFASKLECRNAALLQMMQTAVEDGKAVGMPVLLNHRARAWVEAIQNIESFSVEERQDSEARIKRAAELDIKLRPFLSVPRLRKCYGWLSISGEILAGLPQQLRPPDAEIKCRSTRWPNWAEGPDTDYMAIVYEYVEEAPNSPAAVQEVVDFLHLAGFTNTLSPWTRNWQGSVLLDILAIASPYEWAWRTDNYIRLIKAEWMLRT
ncbi:hypothetical protein CMQ_6019 [Grosmannia clavigera kw1407]|uniref:Uncharacterized protein n=1 Tax=Grosmannia clavigera (strain kw1407 / UAMH 11150) TaxID=655863 RepID=F0XL93_GROCL|nr:uncharacterized protein CMQ_6019 [Grosmannia clavigera kw1407]EFX01077.1 hypothetical protein CMQ_6019 [Grosmannia clavigera kw1407]